MSDEDLSIQLKLVRQELNKRNAKVGELKKVIKRLRDVLYFYSRIDMDENNEAKQVLDETKEAI